MTDWVTDRSGNSLSGLYHSSFRVAPDPGTRAPRVEAFHPECCLAVPVNTILTARMSEPIDVTTVTAETAWVRTYDGGVDVLGSWVLDVTGTRLSFVPDGTLPAGERLRVTFTSGIEDATGVPLESSQAFDVLVGDEADTTAPVVVESSPADGTVGVGINAGVRLRFDEAVNPLTVDGETVVLAPSGGGADLVCAMSFGESDHLVTVVPHAGLGAATEYTLRVAGVTDLAGNGVAEWTTRFRTSSGPDVTRPTLVRVTPSGEDVGVNAVLVAEFSEAIDPASVDASTVRLQNGTTGEFVEVDWSVSGSVVYVVPTLVLSVGTYYTVYLEGGIEDLSGNALTWSQYRSFRTGFGADVTGPEVVGVDPPEGSLGVATNGRVTVGLSEALDPISVSGSSVFLESDGGGVVEGQLQLENGNRRVVLTPTAHLDPETGYTVTVSGVRDIAGNALSGAVTSGFVTGLGADLVSPRVVGVSPESGTTGVARDVVVRVELSEAVNALTVDETSVYLQEYYGAVAETAVVVDASRRVILVTPLELLKANTQYQLRLQSGVKDTAGNSLSTYYPTFTTGE